VQAPSSDSCWCSLWICLVLSWHRYVGLTPRALDCRNIYLGAYYKPRLAVGTRDSYRHVILLVKCLLCLTAFGRFGSPPAYLGDRSTSIHGFFRGIGISVPQLEHRIAFATVLSLTSTVAWHFGQVSSIDIAFPFQLQPGASQSHSALAGKPLDILGCPN